MTDYDPWTRGAPLHRTEGTPMNLTADDLDNAPIGSIYTDEDGDIWEKVAVWKFKRELSSYYTTSRQLIQNYRREQGLAERMIADGWDPEECQVNKQTLTIPAEHA